MNYALSKEIEVMKEFYSLQKSAQNQGLVLTFNEPSLTFQVQVTDSNGDTFVSILKSFDEIRGFLIAYGVLK